MSIKKVNLCHHVDIKLAAAKNLKPNTKYCIFYNVLEKESGQCAIEGKSSVQLAHPLNFCPVTRSDEKGFIPWSHKNTLSWTDTANVTTLKFQCFLSKKAGAIKNLVGEIIIPLNSLPSGEQKKRWVKMKSKGTKTPQSLMLSVRYLDKFAFEYFKCSTKSPENEEKLLQLITEHENSIPANFLLSFSTKTALHTACFNNHTQVSLELLKRGADCNILDSKGTPLMLACKQSNEEVVFEMLGKGKVDFAIRDNSKQSLLHYACKGQSSIIVQKLLELGWDPAEITSGTKTPLHYAAHSGSDEQIKLLLDAGVVVDVPSDSTQTPLILAVKKQHLSSVVLLLENNADPDLDSHIPPTVIAVNNGDVEMLKLLLQASKKEKIVRFHAPCVHTAARKGFLNILEVLIPLRTTVIQSIHNGLSCVHDAVIGNQPQIIRYLASQGADPNLVCESWEDMEGVTPLALAVASGKASLVSALIESFPDIDVATTCAWELHECSNLNILHIAILVKSFDILKLLLDNSKVHSVLEMKTKSPNRTWRGLTPKNLAFSKGMSDYLKEIQNVKVRSPALRQKSTLKSAEEKGRKRMLSKDSLTNLMKTSTEFIPGLGGRHSANSSPSTRRRNLSSHKDEARRNTTDNLLAPSKDRRKKPE